jgi:phage tail sheath protein FI
MGAAMVEYSTPGVHPQDVFLAPAPSFLTGVPVFLGYTTAGIPNAPQQLTLWPQFETTFGAPRDDGYLAPAIRGFFENDGLLCYVVRLDEGRPFGSALREGLASSSAPADVDLVCAPDIMRSTEDADVVAWQRELVEHCQRRGERFAILDGFGGADTSTVEAQRAALAGPAGGYGALYFPWLGIPGPGPMPAYVPPCGHVAGIYSRSDRQVGTHKAPANEVVEGVLDLAVDLAEQQVGALYGQGVNCIRALRGRGIRIWGARTLSDDPAWQDITARRVVLTMSRWIERFMNGLVLEPNDVRLWIRILRELTAYLRDLFQRGAFAGRTPDEAFFVKCDAETNPPAVVDAGLVVTQIGVALTAPTEFTVVRIIHGASGVTVSAT